MGGPGNKSSLRRQILAFVGALVLLSLLGSTITLYRITEVNRSLDAINRVSVPMGRLFAQIQADADVFRLELNRSLGYAQWNNPNFKPKPVPRWIIDVIDNEIDQVRELTSKDLPWSTPESRVRWDHWVKELAQGFAELKDTASRLHFALEQRDRDAATKIYPQWSAELEEWVRHLQWGGSEYERSLRQTFSLAESRVAELRIGLEIILVVVVSFSLLLLWLGERALRPLGELTRMAREITRRGLRKEDKLLLPQAPLSRNDEVSQLAREFYRMATALLEREKDIEIQKDRVQEQNKLLREMGQLNENVLNNIESILIVTDLFGRITQCNPVASQWLTQSKQGTLGESQSVIGSNLMSWPRTKNLPFKPADSRPEKIEAFEQDGRVYGGRVMPLRSDRGEAYGAIVALEDLTEELSLQDRLRHAENLAAVGRMSAQVAHEVRNPLHSIGLEAELAVEAAGRLGGAGTGVKQSLQSILSAVDRLEKITENYLKLSRLSTGEKTRVDLSDVLTSVLATYAPECESRGIKVDWTHGSRANPHVWGDRDLLEQVLGNLMRNSLQALEALEGRRPRIAWNLGYGENGRACIRIEDNGPGISPDVRAKLFTPFVTTRAQGTGLGLSFVKKVIEDHYGTIACRDLGMGEGASFEIQLPSADELVVDASSVTVSGSSQEVQPYA